MLRVNNSERREYAPVGDVPMQKVKMTSMSWWKFFKWVAVLSVIGAVVVFGVLMSTGELTGPKGDTGRVGSRGRDGTDGNDGAPGASAALVATPNAKFRRTFFWKDDDALLSRAQTTPTGIAIGPDGAKYVSGRFGATLWKLAADGLSGSVLANFTVGQAQLQNFTSHLTTSFDVNELSIKDGVIYFSAFAPPGGGLIGRCALDGTDCRYHTQVVTGPTSFFPVGLAVVKSITQTVAGVLYVGDVYHPQIYRVYPNGTSAIWLSDARLGRAGTFASNTASYGIGPFGMLSMDLSNDEGSLYVAMFWGQVFEIPILANGNAGTMVEFIDDQRLAGAASMTMDAANRLWVTSVGGSTMSIVDVATKQITPFFSLPYPLLDDMTDLALEHQSDKTVQVWFVSSGGFRVTTRSDGGNAYGLEAYFLGAPNKYLGYLNVTLP